MKRRIAFLLAVLMCGSLLLSAVSPAAMAADAPSIPEQAMSKAQAALDAAKQAAAEQGVEIDFDHPQEAIADGEPTPEEWAQLNEAANAAKTAYEGAVKTAQAAGLEIDSDGFAHLPAELDDQADLMQLNALIQVIKASKAAWDAAIKQAEAMGVEIVYDEDYEPAQARPADQPELTPEERAQLNEAANAAKTAYEGAVKTAQAAGLEIDSDGFAHLPAELDDQADLMQLNALIQVIKASKAAWDAAIKQAEAMGVEIVYDEDFEPAPARPADQPDPVEPIVDPVEPVDDPAGPVDDPVEPDPFRFDDVTDESKFYFAPVYWAVEQKITKGTSEKLFSPDDGCTRAQVVTFLWRAKGEPEPTKAENPFKDVRETDYFYKAVLWAVEKGITKGTSADKFSPEKTCTRAEAVTFLNRAVGQGPVYDCLPFVDVRPEDYYFVSIGWALANGITTGTSPDKFSPNSTCTRGEIVTFLYRAAE